MTSQSSGPVGTPSDPRRVLMLGATGTIGRATVAALLAQGDTVVCLVRPGSGGVVPPGAEVREGDVTDPASVRRGIGGERFDALVSCLASRTGAPRDAWAIDHAAFVGALAPARQAGVRHVTMLSAICVQRPKLAFQHAKLAAERDLMASGLGWTIVRPTAFFKSLSGQIDRVRQGRPYLMFGDGRRTSCKPISDNDLGRFLAACQHDPERRNRVLPIGGPGPSITPQEQGQALFRLLDLPPRVRHVPVGLLTGIATALDVAGLVSVRARDKAGLARIGRYYATESMLVWDAQAGRYDADATPETGTETLFDHYARILRGEVVDDRGDHAVF